MQCCTSLCFDCLQAWPDGSTQSLAAVLEQPEGSDVCSSAVQCLTLWLRWLQDCEADSSAVSAASLLKGPKQSAAVLDQTQAGQDAPSPTAPPTQPAGVPGLTDAGAAASKASPTRQPDAGQRSAEGRAAAPSQPAGGHGPAQVAAAVEQAGPCGQGSAEARSATGVDQDCTSVLQCAEAGASTLVQGSAVSAEVDSADQQRPANTAILTPAKPSDALAAQPAARVGKGSQQAPAEFQEGAHDGSRGAAMACSEPCSALPAGGQDGASSAGSAAGATQGGVLVAQGFEEADVNDGAPTTASKVRHWS